MPVTADYSVWANPLWLGGGEGPQSDGSVSYLYDNIGRMDTVRAFIGANGDDTQWTTSYDAANLPGATNSTSLGGVIIATPNDGVSTGVVFIPGNEVDANVIGTAGNFILNDPQYSLPNGSQAYEYVTVESRCISLFNPGTPEDFSWDVGIGNFDNNAMIDSGSFARLIYNQSDGNVYLAVADTKNGSQLESVLVGDITVFQPWLILRFESVTDADNNSVEQTATLFDRTRENVLATISQTIALVANGATATVYTGFRDFDDALFVASSDYLAFRYKLAGAFDPIPPTPER